MIDCPIHLPADLVDRLQDATEFDHEHPDLEEDEL